MIPPPGYGSWYRITAGRLCGAVEVWHGRVVRTAPVFRHLIGWRLTDVRTNYPQCRLVPRKGKGRTDG